MKAKEKKKNVVYVIGALILLVVIGALAGAVGVFDGALGFISMIHPDKEVVFKLIIMIVFVVFASNLLLILLHAINGKNGRIKTLATVFASLVKYGAVLVAFCWGLAIIGVNVSTIFASVGIVALILGFGAESLVADLVTGIFILFENQYNVGDIIEVDGFRGVVIEIGIRTLSIEDNGGNIKIINNSDLKNIINRSNQKSVAVTDIGVGYDTDLEELEAKLPTILDEIKEKYKDIFIGKVSFSGVEQLGDSAVVLRFVAEVTEESVFKGKRILNKELKCAFDREKITIPFPQVDVHTK